MFRIKMFVDDIELKEGLTVSIKTLEWVQIKGGMKLGEKNYFGIIDRMQRNYITIRDECIIKDKRQYFEIPIRDIIDIKIPGLCE